MKRKDLIMILVVVIVAGIFSLVVSKLVIRSSGQRNQQAQVVQPISTDFQKPDQNVFNETAVNPTQLIQIGGGSNSKPF